MDTQATPFVYLHTYSHYSLLEGLLSPADLARLAVENGMKAIALTDHRCLSGMVEFSQACDQEGIQPIFGMTVDVEWQRQVGEMVLLVKDRTGWSNLCWLSSKLMVEEGGVKTFITLDEIRQHYEGLIALSGGQRSLLDFFIKTAQQSQALEWLTQLKEIFQDSLYIEIQQPTPSYEVQAHRVVEIAKQVQIPMVASHSIYYKDPDQAGLQKTLSAMRENCRIKDIESEKLAPPAAYFVAAKDLVARFHWIPEAIENTNRVAELCNWKLPLGEVHFPDIPLPPGKSVSQLLREKAESGAKKRYKRITAEIQSRLDHELKIIAERGYEPIFLIVEELLNYARQQGVPISSRGSAASSLVAYCLEITNPEPLSLNLYFERFLNPADRKSVV